MKILHLIQKSQYRGAEIFTCQLAIQQRQKGHKVIIISIFKGNHELNSEIDINSLNASPNFRFLALKSWKKLSNIVNEFKPDVVQANAGDTLKYAVFSKKIFGWKTPIIFRNASEVGKYLNSKIQKSFNSYLYKQVSSVASVSRASEKDILLNFPFLEGKTRVIHVGIEQMNQLPTIDLKPGGKKHIIHVGAFSYEKNHLELIRIFKKVLNKESQAHLHLVGDGPLKAKIESKIKEVKLEDRVSFYGFVDNPLSFIKGADVLVLPSIIEGLPGVLLEAMFCKVPVVAYDVGGVSEIINSKTGKLIIENEEDAFANAILDILHNPDLTVRYIEEAYSMVKNFYMNEQLAEDFLLSYIELLSE